MLFVVGSGGGIYSYVCVVCTCQPTVYIVYCIAYTLHVSVLKEKHDDERAEKHFRTEVESTLIANQYLSREKVYAVACTRTIQ